MIPLRDSEHRRDFPLITTAIVVINVLVFASELMLDNPEAFIHAFGFVPAGFSVFDFSSYLPLLTSQFLHGGFLHLASNLWFLWVFGDNVEERIGKVQILGFYLIGGVVAALAQFLVDPGSTIPMIGASGAVAAVLGAYLRFFPHAKVDVIIPLGFYITRARIGAPLMLGWWFITQLFNGVASLAVMTAGGVAFFAHVGGFIYGYLLSPEGDRG